MRRLAVLILCAFALPTGAARAWTWPIDGPVLRGFSFDRAHPYTAGQHRGIDIRGAIGEEVRSPAAGVVSFAGTVPGGGRTISIRTSDGTTVTLLHLGSLSVGRGSAVDEAAVVGTAGPSDDAEVPEPHVYLGIRTTADPQGYLDPVDFLPPRPEATPVADPAPAGQSAGSVPADPAPVADPAPAADPTPADAAPAEEATPAVDPAPAVGVPAEGRPATESQPLETRGRDAAAEDATVGQPAVRRPRVSMTAVTRASNGRAVRHTAERGHRPVADATRTPTGRLQTLVPHDPVLETTASPTPAAVAGPSEASLPWWSVLLVGALAIACAGARLRRRGRQDRARMMDPPQPETAFARTEPEERARRAGLAVRVGAQAPRSRGGVRRAGGHLRAVPPAEGEPTF